MSYETRTFRALGYAFSVSIEDDPALGELVDDLFGALSATDEAGKRWVVRSAEVADDPTCRALILDGTQSVTGTAGHMVPQLVFTLNGLAVRSWDGVACHAGGVSRAGSGVVLPADPESGKTTLTAGLVRAGFEYLTDEAVAFVPGTATIEPFPKPLSLDPGSWFLFPELEPHADLGSDDYKNEQWQVAPTAFRPDAVGGPCDARLMVFPKYVEDAETELTVIGRAEALVELARNTFFFNEKSRAALEALAPVVRAVDCYRLTVGSLDEAVAIIEQLTEALPEREGVRA